MPNMSPERAQHELAKMGESLASDGPITILSAAFRTIANLKWEWRVESTKGAEFASSPWTDEKEARDIYQKAKNGLDELGIEPTDHLRLVRRLVGPVEEVN